MLRVFFFLFLEWEAHSTKDTAVGTKADIMLSTYSTWTQEVTDPVPLRVCSCSLMLWSLETIHRNGLNSPRKI